ncbi:MAG: hypothetical protein BZY88_11165 [SAR202 cluster bacterium Io17-Chloro-G9]|nr:MAG: hypothetical protein BZY88_11165 [SAR202 cluster bacterium Io17-Chloro-G9]
MEQRREKDVPVLTLEPPPPTGASKEVAQRELDNLIQLGQGKIPLDEKGLTAYLEQVGTVLNRIDSDPAVLAAFKGLLEGILGRPIVLEGTAKFNMPSPMRLGLARPLFAPLPSSDGPFGEGPFGCSATDPNYDPFAESTAWRYLKCFMDALVDAVVPGSTFRNAADPVVAEGIGTLAVRTNITRRCIDNIEACAGGEDPVLEKFNQGDIAGAYKTARSEALAPPPTATPTRRPTPTPVPVPTATPTITATSTPVPTAKPTAVSDFSGIWVGRYKGTILYTPTECGSTIVIEGPITATLIQEGARVTGTLTLGGTEVEIEDCKVVAKGDDTSQIEGGVSGDTFSGSGPTSSFSATKSSENSADGTIRDQFIAVTFFVGRLR